MKRKKLSLLSVTSLMLLLTLILSNCTTRLEVLSERTEGTSVETDGKDDFALKYVVRVRNKGAAGKVRAKAKVFTGEGQFYKEQIVYLKSGEDVEIEFVFNEITVPGQIIALYFGKNEIRYEFSYESVS